MATNYANMPPELLKVMLEMSGNPEEKEQIALQMAMAKLLSERATSTDDRAPSHPIGGLGHVAAKGILGYGAGRDKLASEAALKTMRENNTRGRGTYMEHLFGGGRKPDSAFGRGIGGSGVGEGVGANPIDDFSIEEFPYDPMQPPI
jgi:hypothetical protein